MADTLKVRLVGADGEPIPEERARTLYASDLRFAPMRRRSEIEPDGTVEIAIPGEGCALHARIEVPAFGDVWVTADNGGRGYEPADTVVDFVRDAAADRLREVEERTSEGDFSAECIAHREAARELLDLAERKPDAAGRATAEALSHALWAGEYAVVERSRRTIAARPRKEGFLLGCNAFRYEGDTPYARYFEQAFNFATLPFYLKPLEPEEGKPDYSRIDGILEWCERSGIATKGHPLWWSHPFAIPGWAEGAKWGEVQKQCERVVARSVDRYRGRIRIWDVINEAHDWANILHLTHEQEVEITRICCDTAREHDPEATLIVNNCVCFGENAADGWVPFEAPVYDDVFTPLSYLDALVAAGVEFDVIGVQLYFPARDMLAIDKLLDEFARFGKPVHITELGVPSVGPALAGEVDPERIGRSRGEWHPPWSHKVQADWLEWFYTLAYARDEIEAVTWWDMRDPAFMKMGGLLDENEIPKEAYFRLRALRETLLG